jgi:hypothetical protein
MEREYGIMCKLLNGEEKIYHSKVLPGDIVKVTDGGYQYGCDFFDKYFGCFGMTTRIPYDWSSFNREKYVPKISDKDNIWIVTGLALHPFTEQIIICAMNKRGKYCVMGKNGIELLKHGKFTNKPEKIYQIAIP